MGFQDSPCWLCEGGVDEQGRFKHDNACASQARPNNRKGGGDDGGTEAEGA